MKTTLLVPDVQWPYHDQLMVDKLLRVIKDIQPEQIVQIGDGIDFPQVSRWSVGTAGAYAPTLQKHITSYREKFLEPIVSLAPKAKRIWLRGNHDERLEDFIQKYAPALSSLDCLSMESLFKLGKSWSYRAFGYEGKVSPRFTMNLGSLMDPVKATYVKDGSVSWTMSFGLLRDDGKRVYPELITATDRGFFVEGRKY